MIRIKPEPLNPTLADLLESKRRHACFEPIRTWRQVRIDTKKRALKWLKGAI